MGAHHETISKVDSAAWHIARAERALSTNKLSLRFSPDYASACREYDSAARCYLNAYLTAKKHSGPGVPIQIAKDRAALIISDLRKLKKVFRQREEGENSGPSTYDVSVLLFLAISLQLLAAHVSDKLGLPVRAGHQIRRVASLYEREVRDFREAIEFYHKAADSFLLGSDINEAIVCMTRITDICDAWLNDVPQKLDALKQTYLILRVDSSRYITLDFLFRYLKKVIRHCDVYASNTDKLLKEAAGERGSLTAAAQALKLKEQRRGSDEEFLVYESPSGRRRPRKPYTSSSDIEWLLNEMTRYLLVLNRYDYYWPMVLARALVVLRDNKEPTDVRAASAKRVVVDAGLAFTTAILIRIRQYFDLKKFVEGFISNDEDVIVKLCDSHLWQVVPDYIKAYLLGVPYDFSIPDDQDCPQVASSSRAQKNKSNAVAPYIPTFAPLEAVDADDPLAQKLLAEDENVEVADAARESASDVTEVSASEWDLQSSESDNVEMVNKERTSRLLKQQQASGSEKKRFPLQLIKQGRSRKVSEESWESDGEGTAT